jgi:hypothetical protein
LTRRMKGAVALVIVLAAFVIIGRMVTAQDPFVPLVQEVVRTPQTYDGEHIDKLVSLGADAVPAIGAVLLSGESFPIVFVSALERIGDERGTESIVAFVSRQAPYSDDDMSTLTAASILALRGIPNTAACAPVGSILRTETAHPRVRLASASTCAHLCADDLKAEAQSFILGAYQNRSRFLANPNKGFVQEELYSALTEVDNDESVAILLNVLDAGGPLPTLRPVIAYLSRKESPEVRDGLQRVLDSANHELPIRLAVAHAILDTGKPPTQSLRSRIDELANEASPEVYGQAITDEALRMRARAAEL